MVLMRLWQLQLRLAMKAARRVPDLHGLEQRANKAAAPCVLALA